MAKDAFNEDLACQIKERHRRELADTVKVGPERPLCVNIPGK